MEDDECLPNKAFDVPVVDTNNFQVPLGPFVKIRGSKKPNESDRISSETNNIRVNLLLNIELSIVLGQTEIHTFCGLHAFLELYFLNNFNQSRHPWW